MYRDMFLPPVRKSDTRLERDVQHRNTTTRMSK